MRKLFNKPWFVALLAVAALVFVAYTLLAGRGSNPGAEVASEEAVADTSESEVAPNSATPGTSLSIRAALKDLSLPPSTRDPFAARVVAVATVSSEKIIEPDLTESVSVSAIWIQGATTYVLVNSHVYRVGDQIGRLTVESADRDGVWVTHWKGRDFVPVGGAFTLVTPARQAKTPLPLLSGS